MSIEALAQKAFLTCCKKKTWDQSLELLGELYGPDRRVGWNVQQIRVPPDNGGLPGSRFIHPHKFEEVDTLVALDRHRSHDPVLIDSAEIIDNRLIVVEHRRARNSATGPFARSPR